MPVIESQIDRNGDDYKRNRERMLAAIKEFRDAEASVQAASEKARERFAKRKQLMPRERIALLLDRGAPFLELMPLAGYRMHDDKDGSSAGGGSEPERGERRAGRCVLICLAVGSWWGAGPCGGSSRRRRCAGSGPRVAHGNQHEHLHRHYGGNRWRDRGDEWSPGLRDAGFDELLVELELHYLAQWRPFRGHGNAFDRIHGGSDEPDNPPCWPERRVLRGHDPSRADGSARL